MIQNMNELFTQSLRFFPIFFIFLPPLKTKSETLIFCLFEDSFEYDTTWNIVQNGTTTTTTTTTKISMKMNELMN